MLILEQLPQITVVTLSETRPVRAAMQLQRDPFPDCPSPPGPLPSLTINSPRNGGDHVRDRQESLQASMGHQEGKGLQKQFPSLFFFFLLLLRVAWVKIEK